MNTETLKKCNQFGKIGKIILNFLLFFSILFSLLNGIVTIYTTTLPKDAMKVSVKSLAEFQINDNSFSTIWNSLVQNATYATNNNPSSMLEDNTIKVLPEENTDLNGELKFFNQSYSSLRVHSEENKKIIDAQSSVKEYESKDLVTLFLLVTLFCTSLSVSLYFLRKIFKVLSVCESPFCMEFVLKLRTFGYSLLPFTFFASIGETYAIHFLSAKTITTPQIQWGLLISFAVTMFLVTIFRYGVKLQKESDETL